MNQTDRHSKTPWTQKRDEIIDSDERIIAFVTDTLLNYRANARHIIHCVNSHDDLVEALKKLTNKLISDGADIDYPDLLKKCQTALQLESEA